MLSNGCSWYETHRLGGCIRRSTPRDECLLPGMQPLQTRHRLALIVPYRSKSRRVVLHDVSELCTRVGKHLSQTDITFQIFIANQVDHKPFNRGALANAVVAALADERIARGQFTSFGSPSLKPRRPLAFDYLAVHDVDRFPVTANASNQCERATAQYYQFPSAFPRVLHPLSFAGGVLLVTLWLYLSVNGFSNSYWGWGEEDNDMFLRLRWCGLPPIHGDRLDECMEHRDCAACRIQKQKVETHALHTAEHRMRKRLPHPRPYMLRDGVSSLNFTLQGRPYGMQCGATTATIMDINLSGHRTSQS